MMHSENLNLTHGVIGRASECVSHALVNIAIIVTNLCSLWGMRR